MQSTPQRTVGGLCKYFFFITTFWTDLWNNMFLKWKAFIKKKSTTINTGILHRIYSNVVLLVKQEPCSIQG